MNFKQAWGIMTYRNLQHIKAKINREGGGMMDLTPEEADLWLETTLVANDE